MTDSKKTGAVPIGKLEKLLKIPSSELAYAANAVSDIASVAGFFAERAENRKIIGKLGEIQDYMKDLDQKTDKIIKQNQNILTKLNDILTKIRENAQKNFLSSLQKHYLVLDIIKKNYFLLNPEEKKRYRINTFGWDRISEALNYLVFNEFRLRKIIELIRWFEFSLIVTEGKAIQVIRSMTFDKVSKIVPLFSELRDKLRSSHNALLTLLTSQYVASHNLSENLQNLDDLQYQLSEDKKEETVEWVLDCDIKDGGLFSSSLARPIADGCRKFLVRFEIPENIEFNKVRKEIPKKIKESLDTLKNDLDKYAATSDVLLMLLSYFDLLSKDAVQIEANPLDKTVATNVEIASDEAQFVPMA